MNNNICQQFGERLVDYADGELGPAEVAEVESHLATCETCREELRLLERSLELARVVWDEPVGVEVEVQQGESRRRVSLAMTAGVATCAVALAIMFGLGLFTSAEPRQQDGPRNPGPIAASTPVIDVPATPDAEEEIDLTQLIAQEGRAARLAASARLLATQPSLAQYQQRAERYLTETYGETAAARSVLKQNVPLPIKEPQS